MNRRFAFAAITAIFALSVAYANLQQKQKSTSNETKETRMFQGLRTVIYHVDDLQKAKEWYSNVLGFKPYFDEPFYVGFNVGGFELGLDPDMKGISKGNNVVAYWGVKDAKASYQTDSGAWRKKTLRPAGSWRRYYRGDGNRPLWEYVWDN